MVEKGWFTRDLFRWFLLRLKLKGGIAVSMGKDKMQLFYVENYEHILVELNFYLYMLGNILYTYNPAKVRVYIML